VSWLSDASIARLREVADRPDMTGTRYELIREIGRGGMGAVYEANDTLLDRHVALKVIASEWSNAEAAERLQREARTIARLEHPGIVPVHDVGLLADGRVYYAMKLVRGVRLNEYAQAHTALPDLLRVFLRVCEAVAYAHANGVVHRDLKPENIMVGEFGEVLVLDWGVARHSSDQDPAGTVVGTRAFMSPEQARGEAVDPRTDVFSLGLLLRQLSEHEPGTRRLKAIIAKATAEDREQRYDNAAALAEDVVRFVDGGPVLAHRENVFEKTARWAVRHQALLTMIAAYLIMRAIVLVWTNR
jgi:serine/threonine protein kinase